MTSREVAALVKAHQSILLDIGCGDRKAGPNFIGMDARKLPGVDIVHDLEAIPWPLPDDCARVIVFKHVLEHVKPWKFLDVMNEVHRVAVDDAQIMISGPYALDHGYLQDPTHCRPIVEATFCYFDNRHDLWKVYKPRVFHLQDFELVPAGTGRNFEAALTVCKAKACPHT